MRNRVTLGVCIAIALATAFLLAARSSVGAQSGGSDEAPDHQPLVIVPTQFQIDKSAALMAAGPSSTVYFTSQDSNDTNTILFLYNTSAVQVTVDIAGYNMTGGQTVGTALIIPANGLVRITADQLSTAGTGPPASWSNAVLIDFGDATAYVRLTLPAGVKPDGWIAWMNSPVFDPRASVGTVPLRFSSDSSMVFLPSAPRP